MIIFAKYGEYDRRELLEECLTKYLETMKKTKLEGELTELKNHNDKPYFKDYPDVRFRSHTAARLSSSQWRRRKSESTSRSSVPALIRKSSKTFSRKARRKKSKTLKLFLRYGRERKPISNSRARGFRASGQTTCRAICFTRASASSQRRSTFSRDTSARSLRKTSPLFSSISIDLSKKI